MALDLTVLIVVVLFVFLGYRKGLLRKLATWGALLLASVTAGFVGRAAVSVASPSRMGSFTLYAICCVVAWVVIFLLSRWLLGLVARKLGSEKEGKPKPWNKKLGALVGGLEACALCWFVIGILDALPEDFRKQRIPRLHRELEGSLVTNWVIRPTSPATRLELQPLIGDLAVVAEHPEALQGIERKPEIRKIATHPKAMAVLRDRELMDVWLAGEYGRFFSDRKVREALEDPELRAMLRELPVGDILHEAAERARRDKK